MKKSQFRALVVLTLLLTILSIVYDFFCADPIAEKLFAYQDILDPDWSDTKFYLVTGTISLAVLAALVGFAGLLVFRNFSRHLFLFACVLFLAVTPFIGPYITSGANQALFNVVNVLSGLILGLVYFSPIKHYFISNTSQIDSDETG